MKISRSMKMRKKNLEKLRETKAEDEKRIRCKRRTWEKIERSAKQMKDVGGCGVVYKFCLSFKNGQKWGDFKSQFLKFEP